MRFHLLLFFWFLAGVVLVMPAAAQIGDDGGGSGYACVANGGAAPAVRGESMTAQGSDITVNCLGGIPTAEGALVPSADITITFNTQVTSRLLSADLSEALLIIDEPGTGITGPTNTQRLCSGEGGVCSITGTGSGVGTYDGSPGRPNMFLGTVTGNAVPFRSVPQDPPASGSQRIYRFTNIRLNAAALATPALPMAAVGSISSSLMSGPCPAAR